MSQPCHSIFVTTTKYQYHTCVITTALVFAKVSVSRTEVGRSADLSYEKKKLQRGINPVEASGLRPLA